jgi:hypothetical protein
VAGTTVTEHTGDGTTVAFTFSGYNGTDDGGYLVSVGGIDQPPSKYSISSTAGGTITFVDAPVNGELISIRAVVGAGGGGSGDATSLQGRDLSDQAPDDRMSVTWNQALNTWQPSFTTELAGVPIDSTTPTTGNLLQFDGANWTPFDGVGIQNWSASGSYAINDKVYYQGLVYINRSASNSSNPAADPANWEQASGGSSSPGPTDPINVAYWMRINFEGAYSYIPVYR